MLLPGMESTQTKVSRKTGEEVNSATNSELKASIGGGIGFDIGVSDFITLTPMINARYTPQVDGDHLMTDKVIGDDFSDVFQFFGGINIGLRFKKY